ncbi:hypothetical protein ABIE51_001466 [Lysobacter sp. OAE881]|uniref:hypothetical protein n=1 Tax=Lysobacter sp. OAE881 TaxID=2663813 RepID=UPI00178ABC36
MAAVDCSTRVGFASAAAPTAWSGGVSGRSVTDWLPPYDSPVLDPKTGKFTKAWYRFFRELGNRVGGAAGPSITQVVTTVAETQQQVANNTVFTAQAVDYAASVAATAEATAQVAQNNGLSGAGSIPPTGNRPNYQVQ